MSGGARYNNTKFTNNPHAMRIPPSPIQLVLFVFILILLFTLVQIGLLHIAAEKLGIDFSTSPALSVAEFDQIFG